MADSAYSLKVDIEGLDRLAEIEKYIVLKSSNFKNKSTEFVYVLESLIKANLSNVLGNKARHFTVLVERAENGASVNIISNDYLGIWIYRGTKAHWIEGSSPMPIAEGVFRMAAHHPGQLAMKPQIDSAIKQALLEARRLVKII